MKNEREFWDDGSQRHNPDFFTRNNLYTTMKQLKKPCSKPKLDELLNKYQDKYFEKREGKKEQDTPQAKAEWKMIPDIGIEYLKKYRALLD